jgi:hypothetical protein
MSSTSRNGSAVSSVKSINEDSTTQQQYPNPEFNVTHYFQTNALKSQSSYVGPNLQYDNIPSLNLLHDNIPSLNLLHDNIPSSNLLHDNISSSNLQYNNISSSNLQYNNIPSSNLQYDIISSSKSQSEYLNSIISRAESHLTKHNHQIVAEQTVYSTEEGSDLDDEEKRKKRKRTNYKDPERLAILTEAVNVLVDRLNSDQPLDMRSVSKRFNIPYNTLRDNYLK